MLAIVLGIGNTAVSKIDQDLILIVFTSYGESIVEKILDGEGL